MIAALLEALAEVGFDLLFWIGGTRWILFGFFLVAAILCFISGLYLYSMIAVAIGLACALWPRKFSQDQAE